MTNDVTVTRATPLPATEAPIGQLALDMKPRNYTVAGTHARGGMGAILSAKDLNLGRTVAMKVVLRDRQVSHEQLLRFVEEVEVPGLTRLTIPAHCRDIEFLRGLPNLRNLDNRLTKTPRPAAEFWAEYDARRATTP